MLYEEFVRDFAERTESNLSTIDITSNAKNPAAFEVTQIINSTMGILIFPVEEYLKRLKIKSVFPQDLFGALVSEIKFSKGNKNPTAEELLKKIRNAFAHCNIKVRGGKEIESLVLWNQYDENSPINWRAELKISTLRKIIVLVAGELKKNIFLSASPDVA